MYKTSDPATSTTDWVSLNFDSIPHEAIVRIFGGDAMDDLERLYATRTGTCDACNGEGVDPGDETEDCAACDGSGESQESDEDSRELYDWPAAHGTLWQCEDRPETVAAALAAGFVVYRPAEVLDGLLLGIDGGGYSFYGAHWIPLRATLAAGNEHLSNADRGAIAAMLLAEASREGEQRSVSAIFALTPQ